MAAYLAKGDRVVRDSWCGENTGDTVYLLDTGEIVEEKLGNRRVGIIESSKFKTTKVRLRW